MEDNGRGLEPDPVENPDPVDNPPIKSEHPSSKQLTVMLIGSVGKIHSFKISRKFIIFASIFFSVYLIVSLFIFYLYFNLYAVHRVQSKNLKVLETELSDKIRTLEENKLYIEGLEDYINTLRGESEKNGNTDKAQEKTRTPEKKDIAQKKKSAGDSVGIKDIVFRRVNSELILDFKMTNNLAEQNPAEGYVHIIVMDKDKECPSAWNQAENRLSNCYPADYRSGQQFLIQRFKTYQRRFKISPDSALPSFIRVLVYDRLGKKILEKEFPVTNVSADEPNEKK